MVDPCTDVLSTAKSTLTRWVQSSDYAIFGLCPVHLITVHGLFSTLVRLSMCWIQSGHTAESIYNCIVRFDTCLDLNLPVCKMGRHCAHLEPIRTLSPCSGPGTKPKFMKDTKKIIKPLFIFHVYVIF